MRFRQLADRKFVEDLPGPSHHAERARPNDGPYRFFLYFYQNRQIGLSYLIKPPIFVLPTHKHH
jgi:hypothetical protein